MSRFKSCKDCVDRTVGCHSTCSKYLQDKKEHDRAMEEYRKANGTLFASYVKKKKTK